MVCCARNLRDRAAVCSNMAASKQRHQPTAGARGRLVPGSQRPAGRTLQCGAYSVLVPNTRSICSACARSCGTCTTMPGSERRRVVTATVGGWRRRQPGGAHRGVGALEVLAEALATARLPSPGPVSSSGQS